MKKIYFSLPLVAFLIITSGCSHETGCDLPRQEPLDSASSLHLLGNSEVSWETNPPTSGPHYPIPPKGGDYDYQLSNLEQVSFLESGGVIIQYRPDRDDIDHQKLHSFASASVIVAPNKTIQSALISTAWTWKLSCKKYDSESLNNFIKDHEGKIAPNHKD